MRLDCKLMRLLAGMVAYAALSVGASAQMDFAIGSIIKDFSLPQRNPEGELKLQIFGDQATVISANRIKVENLRIELFEGGQPDIQINSPVCDFWRQENRLTTRQNVIITHPALRLTANQMDWELNENRGLFQGNVQVTLLKSEITTPPPPAP